MTGDRSAVDVNPVTPSVLVVDDDAYVRGALERMLMAIGVRTVYQAASAASALEVAGRPPSEIDVIISDLEMPGMDGMAFLRLLSKQRPNASVLIISGKDAGILRSVELMAREYGLHVLGVLSKPATMAALREMLSRHRAAPARAAPVEAGVRVADLERAVDRREFTLFFQPKVDLASRRVSGAEGLVRWRHPDCGLLAPSLFIGLAERHDLMDRLTWTLFDEAALVARRWNEAGFDVPISLNVSQSTLADTSFAARAIDAFGRCGVPPAKLIVEVTETVAMTDAAHCLESLVRLRMHGVGLSIDDFGTGHASFQQLSRVPYTELKIDRSFVTGVSGEPRLQAIVESSIGIARQLGLTCAAEGIETRNDWVFLLRAGCRVGQGYFIARPMEADRLPEWARGWEAAEPDDPS